jgi:hypothetical protein
MHPPRRADRRYEWQLETGALEGWDRKRQPSGRDCNNVQREFSLFSPLRVGADRRLVLREEEVEGEDRVGDIELRVVVRVPRKKVTSLTVPRTIPSSRGSTVTRRDSP